MVDARKLVSHEPFASLLAMIANIWMSYNGKKGKYEPKDFMPTYGKQNKEAIKKLDRNESIEVLKALFGKNRTINEDGKIEINLKNKD